MLASLHAAPREQPVQLSLPGGEDHGGSRERHYRLDTPLHHALCVLTRKAFLTCAPSPSCAVVLHPTVLSVISQAGTAFSTEIDLGNALQHFERRSFRVVILLSFSLSTSRHGLHLSRRRSNLDVQSPRAKHDRIWIQTESHSVFVKSRSRPLRRLSVRLRHSRSNTSTKYSLPGESGQSAPVISLFINLFHRADPDPPRPARRRRHARRTLLRQLATSTNQASHCS